MRWIQIGLPKMEKRYINGGRKRLKEVLQMQNNYMVIGMQGLEDWLKFLPKFKENSKSIGQEIKKRYSNR